jgi:hypothetical protein
MDILTALLDLISAAGLLVWAVVRGIAPWIPLLAWIAFWTLAVDWVRLRAFLLKGGWIGVLLLGLVAVLVWGVVAPPEGGVHSLLGLQVSNFVGKMVYVTTLTVIMLLCGSTQLSGACDRWLNLEQPASGGNGHGDDHGHGDHGQSDQDGHDAGSHHGNGHHVALHHTGH